MRVLGSLNAADLKLVGQFASQLERNDLTEASTQENKQAPFCTLQYQRLKQKN
tara:strand:- start:55 stop:213 length:159 start_codon:yes stop_codon:yes gene_type:complete